MVMEGCGLVEEFGLIEICDLVFDFGIMELVISGFDVDDDIFEIVIIFD